MQGQQAFVGQGKARDASQGMSAVCCYTELPLLLYTYISQVHQCPGTVTTLTLAEHPDYAAYQKQVPAFIPLVRKDA